MQCLLGKSIKLAHTWFSKYLSLLTVTEFKHLLTNFIKSVSSQEGELAYKKQVKKIWSRGSLSCFQSPHRTGDKLVFKFPGIREQSLSTVMRWCLSMPQLCTTYLTDRVKDEKNGIPGQRAKRKPCGGTKKYSLHHMQTHTPEDKATKQRGLQFPEQNPEQSPGALDML